MSKDEYFSLTPAETYTKCKAYIYNRDVMAANFRQLFQLQYNQWSKYPKEASSLWPLTIDESDHEQLTEDEMYKRNEEIIKKYRDKFWVN